MNRRYVQSTIVIALTLALHVALWYALRSPWPRRANPQPVVRMTVLRVPPADLAAAVDPPSPRYGEIDDAQRTGPRVKAQARAVAPSSIAVPIPSETASAAAVASPSPAAAPSLLDTQGTRRAIREAARQPSLAERGERAGTDAQRPDQRLGDSIAEGAKGDCLKGEYTGAGMGLLSLPFLAVAVLGDHCRR